MPATPSWWMPGTATSFQRTPGKPIGTTAPFNPAFKNFVGGLSGQQIEKRVGGSRDWEKERSAMADWNAGNPEKAKTWDQWAQMVGLGYGPQLGWTGNRLQTSPIPANWMELLKQPPSGSSAAPNKPKVAAGITLPSWWDVRNTMFGQRR